MAERRTEAVHKDAAGLDTRAPEAVLRLLADGQIEAAAAVRGAVDAIAEASAIVAEKLLSGGRLVYAAAGSSGLMALADALELPGTYGIPLDRVVVLLAGGVGSLTNLAGEPEDDEAAGAVEIEKAAVAEGDCVIALSASGSTPYALGALKAAKARGAAAIAVANNAGTPLLDLADVPILLATPPEVIAGSTRMGAGTAQKIALNMLSTMAAIRLGHVHDGYMVNLRADNLKLKQRAARMVAAIAGCSFDEAQRRLDEAGGSVKAAILLAAGAANATAAQELLDGAGQKLRPALSRLGGSAGSRHNRT